ncbi:FAD/NAD-P-binding domain-containing protein [Peniophora sp. CONT]|nr:FAD/NAD-P-binding domain-containing protein [Peniophora sp. CONT]
MTSKLQKDFTVAIIGGGVVGLVCAIGLARAGVQVDLFEAASKYGEIGAGIGIGHNALRVFEAMGILEDINKATQGPRLPFFTFLLGADPHTIIYQFPDDMVEKDQGLGVHRASLIKALASLLPSSVRSHFRMRCVGVTAAPNGRAEVRFADGSVHAADIVIGADGIKSVVRGQVLGDKGERLVDTGHRCYRSLFPVQRLLDAGVDTTTLAPRGWMGPSKHLVSYRIGDGSMFNLAAFATDHDKVNVPAGPQTSWADWVSPVPRAELLDAMSDFGSDARAILECTDESVTKWKIHGLYPPLETHVGSAPSEDGGEGKLNVVLIGDAAHAMVPYLASGASAGIEDAYVLASLLGHPQTGRANLSDILRVYNTVHVPRAAYIANASKRAGEVYHGRGPSGPSDEGRRKDLDSQWTSIWDYDVKAEVAKAIEVLVGAGVF